jgi:hypothetical protein
MKDFTKIQIQPIPPSISALQKTNGALKGQNDFLKNLLVIAVVTTVGVGIYYLVKKHEEDEERKRRGV